MLLKVIRILGGVSRAAVVTMLAAAPGMAAAEIVWDGNFNGQSFKNYHKPDDPASIAFFLVPDYGRPPQYGSQVHTGNGDLLDLVDAPTRGSDFSARFVVKSQAGGGLEPTDCDPAVDCGTRRSQLQMTSTLYDYYNAIPQGAERWLSISFYLPSDFNSSGGGFGPVLWGSKAVPAVRSGAFGIGVQNGAWYFKHRYYGRTADAKNYTFGKQWWIVDDYDPAVPSSDHGHIVDFPDVAASRAALANLNKGGWTDWMLHFKTDLDDFESNSGFLDVYMRAGSGEWVHVIKLRPQKNFARMKDWASTMPERLYDRGIGQVGSKGYTSQMGLYMDKGRIWNHDRNMVIYMDNHKIGDEGTSFADMSHDGSAPGQSPVIVHSPPNPPQIAREP